MTQWSSFIYVTYVDQKNTDEFGGISTKEARVSTAAYYEVLLIS